MFKNRVLMLIITLLLLVVLTVPVIAEEFKSEIEPRAIDCPNCYGYIIIERTPRKYTETRQSDCKDCQRNFEHTKIEEYEDIVIRCIGSCGYRQTDSKFIRGYCTN